MPIQAPSWTEFLSCPICCNEFAPNQRLPISLGCCHTICRLCLGTIHNRQCPFDQTLITTDIENLPVNFALLQLIGSSNCANLANDEDIFENSPPSVRALVGEDFKCYRLSKKCIENLALHLKPMLTNGNVGTMLSRPMQRKLVTLVNCQLIEVEGRIRALRAARSLGERTVTELILQHQNPQQLSSNLWAAVRSRGCQFLGPPMQEQVLKLVLLALQDGKALSRKELVMSVVKKLELHYPQASKTSIGHVVQLLYRASCFKVSKREADSSLMQLKEEFRTYETLRREHDAQIVQIATEAGLRIAPEQWSSLLYGDTMHKSHMQSIIDKLQTPSSFAQSVQELVIALQRTSDPSNLSSLHAHLKLLANIDPIVDTVPSWQEVAKALDAVRFVVVGLVEYMQHHGNRKLPDCSIGQMNPNAKYKISLCRDLFARKICTRGSSCTFAHTEEELERYRAKSRKNSKHVMHTGGNSQNSSNCKNDFQLQHNHHSPHTVMLHPGDDSTAPTSVSTSPMRYATPGHGKPHRGNYRVTSPLNTNSPPGGHNIHSMHHSPIPTGSNVLLGAGPVPPINVPPLHCYDPSYQPLNFNSPTPAGIVSPNSFCKTNSGILPSMNFTTFQPSTLPPSANMTTVNPPKYLGNNASGFDTQFGSKGLYNVLASDLYNTGAVNPNSSFFGSGNNSTVSSDFSIPLNASKLATSNSMWVNQKKQQTQHQGHVNDNSLRHSQTLLRLNNITPVDDDFEIVQNICPKPDSPAVVWKGNMSEQTIHNFIQAMDQINLSETSDITKADTFMSNDAFYDHDTLVRPDIMLNDGNTKFHSAPNAIRKGHKNMIKTSGREKQQQQKSSKENSSRSGGNEQNNIQTLLRSNDLLSDENFEIDTTICNRTESPTSIWKENVPNEQCVQELVTGLQRSDDTTNFLPGINSIKMSNLSHRAGNVITKDKTFYECDNMKVPDTIMDNVKAFRLSSNALRRVHKNATRVPKDASFKTSFNENSDIVQNMSNSSKSTPAIWNGNPNNVQPGNKLMTTLQRSGDISNVLDIYTQESNTAVESANIGATGTDGFRDRDSFVRSDSILDDDAATFHPSSSTLGNKYGPICPMYKGQATTSHVASNTNPLLHSWSGLKANSNDGNKSFSVFSNDNLPLKLPPEVHNAYKSNEQNSNTEFEFKSMKNVLDNISFANNALPIHSAERKAENAFGLGLKSLQLVEKSLDKNDNITAQENSKLEDTFLWNLNTNIFWMNTSTNVNNNNNNISVSQPTKNNENCGDTFDNYRRDIEKEMADFCDEVWTTPDDSGIKLD
ncbi:GATA zinc finger domain-containing protein 14 [Teleopsis dalmanni]|uniref:GATA zinc finger domain-containing protein 14 n=1 Tax=Teleopsis dalmanni TaxID=139649 RepID=UPI0018CDE87E|nr:GATA zinc finger domain-containing protein 14 [Teleopsis dalmanni]